MRSRSGMAAATASNTAGTVSALDAARGSRTPSCPFIVACVSARISESSYRRPNGRVDLNLVELCCPFAHGHIGLRVDLRQRWPFDVVLVPPDVTVLPDGLEELLLHLRTDVIRWNVGGFTGNLRPPDRIEHVRHLIVDGCAGKDQSVVRRPLEDAHREPKPGEVAVDVQGHLVRVVAAGVGPAGQESPLFVN